MSDYPRLVYKSSSVYAVVNDDDQRAEALADGWFDVVPCANIAVQALPQFKPQAAQSVDAIDYAAMTRPQLFDVARGLGLTPGGRTSDANLIELIKVARGG